MKKLVLSLDEFNFVGITAKKVRVYQFKEGCQFQAGTLMTEFGPVHNVSMNMSEEMYDKMTRRIIEKLVAQSKGQTVYEHRKEVCKKIHLFDWDKFDESKARKKLNYIPKVSSTTGFLRNSVRRVMYINAEELLIRYQYTGGGIDPKSSEYKQRISSEVERDVEILDNLSVSCVYDDESIFTRDIIEFGQFPIRMLTSILSKD